MFYYQYIKKYKDMMDVSTIWFPYHSCLEKYALGELAEYDLLSYYEDNYLKL